MQSDRFASRNLSKTAMPRCSSSMLSRRRLALEFLPVFCIALSAFRSVRQRFIPRNCEPGRDLLIFLTTRCNCAIWLQWWTDSLHELNSLSFIFGRTVLLLVAVGFGWLPRNVATRSMSGDLMGTMLPMIGSCDVDFSEAWSVKPYLKTH